METKSSHALLEEVPAYTKECNAFQLYFNPIPFISTVVCPITFCRLQNYIQYLVNISAATTVIYIISFHFISYDFVTTVFPIT